MVLLFLLILLWVVDISIDLGDIFEKNLLIRVFFLRVFNLRKDF